MRAGERRAIVDDTDPEDVAAREIVEWRRDQHVDAMLRVHDAVRAATPPLSSHDDVIATS